MFYREHQGIKLDLQIVGNLKSRDWIRNNSRKIYKDRVNIVAELVLNVNGESKDVVVKYFGWRNAISFLLSPFMRSRARKTFDHSFLLINGGVKVPEPIAEYTFRKFGFIKENFIVMEKVGDYRLAREIIRDDSEPLERKIQIVRKIAVMVRKIHELGYIHSDLTPGNFLVNTKNDIYIVDLNRMKKRRFITKRVVLYELAKLNLCQCDLRFEHENCLYRELLGAYFGKQGEDFVKAMEKAIKKNKFRHRVKKFVRRKRKA